MPKKVNSEYFKNLRNNRTSKKDSSKAESLESDSSDFDLRRETSGPVKIQTTLRQLSLNAEAKKLVNEFDVSENEYIIINVSSLSMLLSKVIKCNSSSLLFGTSTNNFGFVRKIELRCETCLNSGLDEIK